LHLNRSKGASSFTGAKTREAAAQHKMMTIMSNNRHPKRSYTTQKTTEKDLFELTA
jgi:hypothetical protein